MLPSNYKYRPLPIGTTIKESQIEGLGLFTNMDLEKDQDLGVSHIIDTRFENDLIRTPLGGFINHSSRPNCKIIKRGEHYHILAIKNIKAGTELTCNYYKSDCAKECGLKLKV